MFLYENNKCPVCDKDFVQGDDVVVCPDCGTPHHRECYNKIGRCANKDKHGTDFIYKRNNTDSAEKAVKPLIELDINSIEAGKRKALSPAENIATEDNNPAFNADTVHKTAEETIDGIKVSDIETVIGNNSEKYVKKFKKGKKCNWNWSAFIFGAYYFMYRKMYLESSIFLVCPVVVSMVLNAVFSKTITAVYDVYTSFYNCMMAMETEKAYQLIYDFTTTDAGRKMYLVVLLLMATTLIQRIVAAIIADNQYRKKVLRIIEVVDEKVNLGDSFAVMGSPLISGSESMSQRDLRNMFLAKQGGVNLFLPLILIALVVISNML